MSDYAMLRFSCPSCKTILQAPLEQAGTIILCPKCKNQMKAPSLPTAPTNPVQTSPRTPPSPASPSPPPPIPLATHGLAEKLLVAADKLKSTWQGFTTPIKMAIGGGSVMMLSCFLCCGGMSILGSRETNNKAGDKNSKEELSQDYFPHKPGAVARYHDSVIGLTGYGPGGVTTTWSFEQGGKITKIAKGMDGRLLDNSVDLYRVKDGFVQIGISADGKVEWYPHIKLGARVGDSWKQNHPIGGVSTFTVKQFDTCRLGVDNKERPCVIIQCDFNNDGLQRYCERTYVKGVGLLLDAEFSVKDGTKQKRLESKLESSQGNLPPAEVAFFE